MSSSPPRKSGFGSATHFSFLLYLTSDSEPTEESSAPKDTSKRDESSTAAEESTSGQTETGGSDKAQKDTERGNDDAAKGGDDDVQHASKEGSDPSLVGSTEKGKVKMTGSGVPGSHSALFGLTPDGKKSNDADYSGKNLPSKDDKGDKKEDKEKEEKEKEQGKGTKGDTSSRAPAAEGVKDQMHDPRVAEKGHGGKAVESEGSGKPGSGA